MIRNNYIDIYSLLFILFITNVVVKSQSPEVKSTSKFQAYEGLGNKFQVTVANFPPGVAPIVQFVYDSGKITPFTLDSSFFNTYIFNVPLQEVDTSTNKRKYDTSCTCQILEPSNSIPLLSNTFDFVKPEITGINPKFSYPIADGRDITIYGNRFKINNDDQANVYFDDIQLTCNVFTSSEIKCLIPNAPSVGSTLLRIVMHNGLQIERPFDYVLPTLDSVEPKRVTSEISHKITLIGTNFYDDVGSPFAVATINGDPCTDIIFNRVTTKFICDTPVYNLLPGESKPYLIELKIGSQVVASSTNLIFYRPKFDDFNPKKGIDAGGTNVVINGHNLMDVSSISIGGSDCLIVQGSITVTQIVCTTSAFNLNGNPSADLSVQLKIGADQTFDSPNDKQYRYYLPAAISTIMPSQITDKGTWRVMINGNGFHQNNKVKLQTTLPVELTPLTTSTDTVLYVDIDSTNLPLGDLNILVNYDGGDTNAVVLKIGQPDITSVTPIGYKYSNTLITMTTVNFPNGYTEAQLEELIVIKIDDKECILLKEVNPTTFTCIAQPSDSVGLKDIKFTIKSFEYTATAKFEYFIPEVTAQVPDTSDTVATGNLDITGTNLKVVEKVLLDKQLLNGCDIETTKISCPIPNHTPDTVEITLLATDSFGGEHRHDTGITLEYQGPRVQKILPAYTSVFDHTNVVITGSGFGDDPNNIVVKIGNVKECINIVVDTQGTEIECEIEPTEKEGDHIVEISVKQASGKILKTVENIKFKTFRLSCVGAPLKDGAGNPPVDWWFVFKLQGGKTMDQYLYLDSTMDQIERRNGLQLASEYSPIQATFAQHLNYNYLFYNDQPGYRKAKGGRGLERTKTSKADGHLKGMVFFENFNHTNNMETSGIHIVHSNPIFPGYKALSGKAYYTETDKIKFLGSATNCQHFFCYRFNNLDQPMEYLVKNNAYLLDNILGLEEDLTTWNQQQQNIYPYFYDFLTLYNKNLRARQPTANKPAAKNSTAYVIDCDALIIQQSDVENVCWWKSNTMAIASGIDGDGNPKTMDIVYFMKTGISKDTTKKFGNVNNRPAWLSKYIQLRKPTKYDGLDLWLIIGEKLQRKMFVEFFAQGKLRPYPPSEPILNVAAIEFSPKLAIDPNTNLKKKFAYKGTSTDHSKLGIPMYPAYGDQTLDTNENMFCIGDSNRHNGQGLRGGGAICIQNPILSHQFNKMIRKYNTFDSRNGITAMHKKLKNSIELNIAVNQPVKVNRPANWVNKIVVEIKDAINQEYFTRIPRIQMNITSNTINDAIDDTANYQALRTSTKYVAGKAGQKSADNIPPVLLQPDILTYVADDVTSVHYLAYDNLVGSICTYDPTLRECTSEKAETTKIVDEYPVGHKIPKFPPQYNFPYSDEVPLRTVNLLVNDNFKLIQFTSEFMQKLPNAKINFYQYMVDTSNTVLKPMVKTPFIVRTRTLLCPEEISYFMTLHYIFYNSNQQEQNVLYKINGNEPNWANGIILAISKKLYNSLITTPSSAFDQCLQPIFTIKDIEKYTDGGNTDNPTQEQLFYRSATAAWDWMSDDTYSDRNGGRIVKVNDNDIIPVGYLLDLMTKLTVADQIENMEGLRKFILRNYRSTTNFKDILINNFIIKQPEPMDIEGSSSSSDGMVITSAHISTFAVEESLISTAKPLSPNERSLLGGIQQILLSLYSMNKQTVLSLSSYQLSRIEQAFDKWITINNQSQIIQSLIIDPLGQYSNQAILFLKEINRNQYGNPIDLGYKSFGSAGTQVTILSPLAITSITFLLESIIMSETTSSVKFGNFAVYYLPKPTGYSGDVSSEYQGMAIAVLNSQLCDVKMFKESDFTSNNFESICQLAGPIITSVDKLSGPTTGGYQITLNGIRFNSSMVINIGERQCQSIQLISSKQLVCTIPSGFGSNHLIEISTSTTIFNLQHNTFKFSYDSPSITNIEPKIIDSFGSQIMTIHGSNFGNDITVIKVLIDSRLKCSPILSVSADKIQCITPPAIGEHRYVSVKVGDQSSTLNVLSLETSTFSFSGPSIEAFMPSSGDPLDTIAIVGEGFGNVMDGDLPPIVVIGDNIVDIENFTFGEINIKLDYETSQQDLNIFTGGDQSIETMFTYLPPVISVIDPINLINTSGQLIRIKGYGMGLAESDLNIQMGQIILDCNPFSYFLECYIPPGIGKDYIVTGSVADQLVDFNQAKISYNPPSIDNYLFKNSNGTISLYLYGNNFVPIEQGFTDWDTTTSRITLKKDGNQQICSSFISSNEIRCSIDNSFIPQSVQVTVANQLSNEFTLHYNLSN